MGNTNISLWLHYEFNLLPPNIRINNNSLNIYIKHLTPNNNILYHLLKQYSQCEFILTNKILWTEFFNISEQQFITNKYSKYQIKNKLKESKLNYFHTNIYNLLPSIWTNLYKNKLPYSVTNYNFSDLSLLQSLINFRIKFIFEKNNLARCLLCNENTKNIILHYTFQCTNVLTTTNRTNLFKAINATYPNLININNNYNNINHIQIICKLLGLDPNFETK